VTQVAGLCPRCQAPLTYEKAGKKHKGYEIAHIYPLNPSAAEVILLQAEERLSIDVDHEDNLIPLCKDCHGRFDTPRTVEDYRELVLLKRCLITRDSEKDLWHQYRLEEEIAGIVASLVATPIFTPPLALTYDAKTVDAKTDGSIAPLTKHKIRGDVQDYYLYVSHLFAGLESERPGRAELIAQQVRTFYVAQKQIDLNQERIYRAVSAWILAKVANCSPLAADIVTSFFVQHCEVFE
jgi:hypothetical protein